MREKQQSIFQNKLYKENLHLSFENKSSNKNLANESLAFRLFFRFL